MTEHPNWQLGGRWLRDVTGKDREGKEGRKERLCETALVEDVNLSDGSATLPFRAGGFVDAGDMLKRWF